MTKKIQEARRQRNIALTQTDRALRCRVCLTYPAPIVATLNGEQVRACSLDCYTEMMEAE